MSVTIQSQYADRVLFAPTVQQPSTPLVSWETEERAPTLLEVLVYPAFDEVIRPYGGDTGGPAPPSYSGNPVPDEFKLIMTMSHGPSPESTLGRSAKGILLSSVSREGNFFQYPVYHACLPANGLRLRIVARSFTMAVLVPTGSELITDGYECILYAAIMPIPSGAPSSVFPTIQTQRRSDAIIPGSPQTPIPKGARSFRVSTDEPTNRFFQSGPGYTGPPRATHAGDLSQWTMVDPRASVWWCEHPDPNYTGTWPACDVEFM